MGFIKTGEGQIIDSHKTAARTEPTPEQAAELARENAEADRPEGQAEE